MARRSALLIGLLLTLFCLLLPACRQTPRIHSPLSQAAVISRDLTVAVYRFWSRTLPFCELYFQFTSQMERLYPQTYTFEAVSSCGELLATGRGCQLHGIASIRFQHQDDEWYRIEDTVQPSDHDNCRYPDRTIVL